MYIVRTLEVASPYGAPKKKKRSSVMAAAIDKPRQCLAPIRHEVFVEHGKVYEAAQFYEAAFGAELLQFQQGWVPKRTKSDASREFLSKRAIIKIHPDLFLISHFDEKSAPT